eukprot:gene16803-12022_t
MSGSEFQNSGPRTRSKSPSSTIKTLTALKSLHDTPVASPPVRTVSPERREWIRKESEDLLTKNLLWREKTKERMYEHRLQHERLISTVRDDRIGRWVMKTKNSPFAVNLVAEDERITEENNIRTREEQERRRMIETRKERAKNEIVLKALSEFSDLEALRKEKRAILEEEQRLRALLALEKVTQNNKADRLVAERAQRQRHDAKLEHRRRQYRDSLEQIMEEERLALMRKHALLNPATTANNRTSLSRTASTERLNASGSQGVLKRNSHDFSV